MQLLYLIAYVLEPVHIFNQFYLLKSLEMKPLYNINFRGCLRMDYGYQIRQDIEEEFLNDSATTCEELNFMKR